MGLRIVPSNLKMLSDGLKIKLFNGKDFLEHVRWPVKVADGKWQRQKKMVVVRTLGRSERNLFVKDTDSSFL
ncbi:hypothetical protein TNCV_1541551 [Trichonephila clavipes]|nr:hypothetical protein TNCV_1541551 [Trichonephila clavipes]